MKISIVTINFNDAKGLKKTLESVAMQQLLGVKSEGVGERVSEGVSEGVGERVSEGVRLELEHVIVDGGSTDESVDIIKDYVNSLKFKVYGLKEGDVKWVSEKDKGIYDGMNKGIRMATGDYIVILNSADCLAAPDVLARMASVLDAETDILLGNIINVYPDTKISAYKRPTINYKPKVVSPTLLNFYHGTIPHDAALIRKSIYETYGYYNTEMKICSDWELFLKAMVVGKEGLKFKVYGLKDGDDSLKFKVDGLKDSIPPLAEGRVKHVDIDMVLFDMTGTSNQNTDKWQAEKRPVLEQMVPATILRDYDNYYADICLMQRIHRHPLAFWLVRFVERVLFKLERWYRRYGLSK